jgi:hypothetical protein
LIKQRSIIRLSMPLKNPGQILPLDLSRFSRIAVLGPSANVTDVFLGDYR